MTTFNNVFILDDRMFKKNFRLRKEEKHSLDDSLNLFINVRIFNKNDFYSYCLTSYIELLHV